MQRIELSGCRMTRGVRRVEVYTRVSVCALLRAVVRLWLETRYWHWYWSWYWYWCWYWCVECALRPSRATCHAFSLN